MGERWYEATRTEHRNADDPELGLYRRFTQALERDFARHHDAPHYADELGVRSGEAPSAYRDRMRGRAPER